MTAPRLTVYGALTAAAAALVLTPGGERKATGTTVVLLAAKPAQIGGIDAGTVQLVRAGP